MTAIQKELIDIDKGKAIIEWVKENAPSKMKCDLIEGVITLYGSREFIKHREETYPNEGVKFSDDERAKLFLNRDGIAPWYNHANRTPKKEAEYE